MPIIPCLLRASERHHYLPIENTIGLVRRGALQVHLHVAMTGNRKEIAVALIQLLSLLKSRFGGI